jgi:hypothetical protein
MPLAGPPERAYIFVLQMKITFPLLKMGVRRSFAAALFLCAFVTAAHAQYDLSGFLPPGVSVNNATPQQITEAVLAAAKQNPDAAADIASGSFQSVFDAGRYSLPGAQDGKQSADPDGSSSDPTLEEWAQRIGDAAKQANPAMAPQIDSAMASALSAAQTSVATGGGGDGGGGGGGGGPPTPIGFGGGGGGGSAPASN